MSNKKKQRKIQREMNRVIRQYNKQHQELIKEKKANGKIPLALRLSVGTPFESDVKNLYENLMNASLQYTQVENLNNLIQGQAQQIIENFRERNPHYNYNIDHDEIHLFFTEEECQILNDAVETEEEMKKLHEELLSLRESALFTVRFQFEMVKDQNPDDTTMRSIADNLSTACEQMIKDLI